MTTTQLWSCQNPNCHAGPNGAPTSSPWWRTADAFPLCTSCEKDQRLRHAAALKAAAPAPPKSSLANSAPIASVADARTDTAIREYAYVDKTTGQIRWGSRRDRPRS
jgi:hypothetical protein